MVSTPALDTPSFGVRPSDLAVNMVYLLWAVVAQWLKRCFETWARSFTTHCLCLSDETLKSAGPFYLVSMPVEVKYPT